MNLQARLSLWLGVALAGSMLAFSGLLWIGARRVLERQLDARLLAEARALASLVEQRATGPLDVEPGALDGYERNHGGIDFAIMASGQAIAGSGAAPGAPGTTGGRRTVVALLEPRWDEPAPRSRTAPQLQIAVSTGTEEIDETLADLRTLLVASGLGSLVLAAVSGSLAVRRGLAPVRTLGRRIDGIDAGRLGERFPPGVVPDELAPVVEKLNELLARLESSFERERRFSADASHELRTPLSGLRAVLEVAAARERSPEEYRRAVAEALAIVEQTSGLTESLLLLARAEAGHLPVSAGPVELRALVDACLVPYAERARERRLEIRNAVPAAAVIVSDRDLLRLIAGNLLANAVEYTEEGGWIRVFADPAAGLLLEVADSGPPIPASELERIFDRFRRLDGARAETGEHAGIGLSLVRALCNRLDLRVFATGEGGAVSFRITARLDLPWALTGESS